MSIRRLTHGSGQYGVKGQVVDVPIDVPKTVQCLPRNVADAAAFDVHIKRQLVNKPSYKKGLVKKRHVHAWLKHLEHSPLYKYLKIKIDCSRLVEQEEECDGKFDDHIIEPAPEAPGRARASTGRYLVRATVQRSAEPGEVQGGRGSEVPGASVRATGWIKGRRAVSSRTQRCSRLGRGPLVPDCRELCLVVSRVKRGKPSAELPHRSRVEQHFGTAQTVLCWTGLPRATDTRGCPTRRPRLKLGPRWSRHLLDAATAPRNVRLGARDSSHPFLFPRAVVYLATTATPVFFELTSALLHKCVKTPPCLFSAPLHTSRSAEPS
ncbi:hypothetical protein HPB50_014662 [Hyalomma asiaticum]|uniref:Uncharacterized protein n=1 Tax=Hyalomma asiaticum TaxID=266040 RepID=A0ACB7S728_HYAAI|nr:hypothetical protein HPB50_014662 [Hyalomma asiaticum]